MIYAFLIEYCDAVELQTKAAQYLLVMAGISPAVAERNNCRLLVQAVRIVKRGHLSSLGSPLGCFLLATGGVPG